MVDRKVDPGEIKATKISRGKQYNVVDKKIKCMFCHRTLAVVGENGDPKGIEIRCPKCKKINKF